MDQRILFFSILVFSLLFYLMVLPILNFYEWIKWWNQQTQIRGQEYKCIDMYHMAYFVNGPQFMFDLYNQFRRPNMQFKSSAEAAFLMNLLMTNSTLLDSDGKVGPRELCFSIVPTGRSVNPTNPDRDGWSRLVAKWCGVTDYVRMQGQGGITGWAHNTNVKIWETDPDNFLFQTWGFPLDSPLVMSFVTNWTGVSSVDGKIYEPSALWQMLSTYANPIYPGGWYGMLKVIEIPDLSFADIEKMCWSDVEPPVWYKKAKSKGCNKTSSVFGAIGTGISSTVNGAMMGAMTGNPFVAVGGAIAGAIFGGMQAYSQYESKCNP